MAREMGRSTCPNLEKVKKCHLKQKAVPFQPHHPARQPALPTVPVVPTAPILPAIVGLDGLAAGNVGTYSTGKANQGRLNHYRKRVGRLNVVWDDVKKSLALVPLPAGFKAIACLEEEGSEIANPTKFVVNAAKRLVDKNGPKKPVIKHILKPEVEPPLEPPRYALKVAPEVQVSEAASVPATTDRAPVLLGRATMMPREEKPSRVIKCNVNQEGATSSTPADTANTVEEVQGLEAKEDDRPQNEPCCRVSPSSSARPAAPSPSASAQGAQGEEEEEEEKVAEEEGRETCSWEAEVSWCEEWEKSIHLGQGGFGEVSLVRSSRGRIVCKRPKEGEESLAEEARLMAECRHRHVVRLFSSPDEGHRLLMEWCEIGDLYRYLYRTRQGYQVWYHQLADALAHIHSREIVHGDLKPTNIFLRSPMDAVIGDFGLARRLGPTEVYYDLVLGTPGYIAPEVEEGSGLTHASDVWSLARIFRLVSAVQRPPRCADYMLDQALSADPADRPKAQALEEMLWALLYSFAAYMDL